MLETVVLVFLHLLLAHLSVALAVAVVVLTGLELEARQLTAGAKATEEALMMGLPVLPTQAVAAVAAVVLRA